ncbi:phospholipase A and acyltransferase 3 isoform X1 [Kryptolebias marmoratus]|uniref:HRAS-like suppressor 3 n=1 Tax=Kryptolebias marmoratus TaxID=37003 RepID=A0A3Q3FNM9_KRYMA|nr:phospholipase A and acyltransferase 3 isoform X1 [Kryptolebias marmoratus]XP_037832443.1 phospholipase A and acyltransferase 3 isoform X1 [Kryptolebias marmoratus]
MSFISFRALGRDIVERFTDMDGKEPKPGDLIQVFRGILYKHWAVYVGLGNVVHFGADGSAPGSSLVPASGQKSGVVMEKLKDVVNGDKWKINNYLDKKYKPRCTNEIVKDACKLVGSGLEYDVLNYNCEHFATELRYGKPESRQAYEARAGFLEGVLEATGAIIAVAAVAVIGIMKS